MDKNIKIEEEIKEEKKPDDEAGLYIEAHIKIFDPQTDEIFVSKRS